MRVRQLHPLAVFGLAMSATLGFALFGWTVIGIRPWSFLLYVALIGVPFVAWSVERVQHWRIITRWQWMLDGLVVAVALVRGLGLLPLVSGHALFLTYALWTTRSLLVRLTASVVMLQVVYVKGFGADESLWWGIGVGCVAGWVYRTQRLEMKG